MGGRGSSTGVSVKNKLYGSEYKSLLTSGNVKFVIPTEKNTTAPLETMTVRRVYVTLDTAGNPKYITYFDKDCKRCKQIDLDKPHRGVSPHVHHGYSHNEYDTDKGFSNLTTKEKGMVQRITEIWKERRSDVWDRWQKRNN